jgi:hypothetical protein
MLIFPECLLEAAIFTDLAILGYFRIKIAERLNLAAYRASEWLIKGA